MTPPPILRQQARDDIDAAIDHYLISAGQAIALDLIAAVEHALTRLRHHPDIGSPRLAQELALPGLRSWKLRRFPYLLFYRPKAPTIEVLRLLHAERDLPAWLRDPPER